MLVGAVVLLMLFALYALLPKRCDTPHLYCTTMSKNGFTEPSKSFCDSDEVKDWVKIVEYKKGNIVCLWRE